jgi:hypothetical protein
MLRVSEWMKLYLHFLCNIFIAWAETTIIIIIIIIIIYNLYAGYLQLNTLNKPCF